MLTNLLKLDFRSTWRDFSGIYLAILLGVIVVPLVFQNVNNQILNITAGFAAFAISIAVIVVMITNLFRIFNTNVFSKQGYLTMTLPVTSRQIVLSKLMISSMWIALTGIVSFIGIVILLSILQPFSMLDFARIVSEVMENFNGQNVLSLVLLLLSLLLSAVKEVSKLFLACSIAHLKRLDRFRVPAGIFSYFLFSWAEAMIVQIVAKIVSLFSSDLANMIYMLEDRSDLRQILDVFNGALSIGIVYAMLLIAAYATATVWLLDRKLDLD